MNKRLATLATLATGALVLATAPAASAGGTGDFYHHWTCKPNYYGYSGITANLDVTNYDIATGQRYHLDMDGGGFTVDGLWIDGVKQSGWNDVYKDFANRGSTHTIYASWFYGPYLLATKTACTIKG